MCDYNSLIVAMVLIGGAIGHFFPPFWENYIRPQFADAFYEGAIIEGDRETTINFYDNTYNKLQIRLERTGHKVTGQVHCVEGYSNGEVFYLKGEFTLPLLVVTYKSLSKQSTEQGSGIFLLNKNGLQLEGQILYPDDKTNMVRANEANMERAKTKFSW